MTASRLNNLPHTMISDCRMRMQTRTLSSYSRVAWWRKWRHQVLHCSCSILLVYTPMSLTYRSHAAMPHGAARPVGQSQAVVLDNTPSCSTAVQHAAERNNLAAVCTSWARQAFSRLGQWRSISSQSCAHRAQSIWRHGRASRWRVDEGVLEAAASDAEMLIYW